MTVMYSKNNKNLTFSLYALLVKMLSQYESITAHVKKKKKKK